MFFRNNLPKNARPAGERLFWRPPAAWKPDPYLFRLQTGFFIFFYVVIYNTALPEKPLYFYRSPIVIQNTFAPFCCYSQHICLEKIFLFSSSPPPFPPKVLLSRTHFPVIFPFLPPFACCKWQHISWKNPIVIHSTIAFFLESMAAFLFCLHRVVIFSTAVVVIQNTSFILLRKYV